MAYYTVVLKEHSVFKTNWFNPENHWSDNIFCVIDDIKDMVTFDGVTWNEIYYDWLIRRNDYERLDSKES